MAARRITILALGAASSSLAACAGGAGSRLEAPVVTDPAPIVSGTMRPYQIRGRWYRPQEQPSYDETGLASWYGDAFHGRPTATGERFDMNGLTAAHKTLPLPGLVEVTNVANGRRIVARLNDRGPFVDGRIIDLSRGSAEALGLLSAGVGEVRVRYLGAAPRLGGGTVTHHARLETPRADGLRGPRPYLEVAGTTPSVSMAPSEPPPLRPALASPTITAPTPATHTPDPSGVWVQAGAWADAGQARRAAGHLGGSATVAPAADGRWRVLVGPWKDQGAGERSRRAVVSRGYPDALLISAP